MCVRVTGALKTFGNKRYINATHLRVASDPHEQYFHILESIAVTLMAERGQVSPVRSLTTTMLTLLDSLPVTDKVLLLLLPPLLLLPT
jgi:hypothetical protein